MRPWSSESSGPPDAALSPAQFEIVDHASSSSCQAVKHAFCRCCCSGACAGRMNGSAVLADLQKLCLMER